MNTLMVNPNDLLKSFVQDYIPTAHPMFWMNNNRRPVLTQFMVQEMLVDPRVQFGLWLIKGPMLSKGRFKVESDDVEVLEYAEKMINRFMLNGAVQALKAIEWGFSGSEVLYERDELDGKFLYKGLKDFESPSVRVVTSHGARTGILINRFITTKMTPGKAVYLGGPKAFHHVHRREFHPWYGRSRLNGPHIPWNETWSEGGYRDIRRLWFYKNAFEGGIIYHPEGHVQRPDGRVVSCQDYAQEMIEKKRSGATLTLPSKVNNGQRLWEYESAKGNTIPAGLFDYGDSLRIEILEGMGIPYEVIESSGGEGLGSSSGRQIPETAFYSILQEELNWLISDFVDQVLRPVIRINAALGFMKYAPIEVTSFPLETSLMIEQDGPQMNLADEEEEEEDAGSFDDLDDESDDKPPSSKDEPKSKPGKKKPKAGPKLAKIA